MDDKKVINGRESRVLKAKIPEDRPLTESELTNILGWWDDRRAYLSYLKDYYDLHHDIENRKMYKTKIDPDTGERIISEDKNKPNNKLIHDFPGYISDVSTGYFMGKPITYTADEEAHRECVDYLQDILDYNDEQTHNINLATDQSIFGTAFEILWDEVPDAGKLSGTRIPRFNTVSPLNCFVVYDPEALEDIPVAAFRVIYIYDVLKNNTSCLVEEYLTDRVYTYKGGEYTSLKLEDEVGKPHYFKQIPVNEYPNIDRKSDFEKVISLVDGYDKLMSDGLNETEGFSNSLLHIRNMMGTNESDLQQIKESGVIKTEDEGDVSYVTKPDSSNNTNTQEAILTKNIHKFSKVPPIDDQNFAGNVSGEAMKYKLWGIETVVSKKERLFKKSIMRRIEIMFELITTIKGEAGYDFTYVKTEFTRNIPRNLSELVDQISKLKGMVSNETLLSWHPDIEDAAMEIEKVKNQEENSNPYNADIMKIDDPEKDEPEDDIEEDDAQGDGE